MKFWLLAFLITFVVLNLHQSSVSGSSNSSSLEYLRTQLTYSVSGAHQPSFLVHSYEDRSRAYTYDQALASIAFTESGDRNSARKILNALWNLQRKSGEWPFSFPLDGERTTAGSVAWVAMAVNAYHLAFHSSEFDSMGAAALDFLDANRVSISFKGIESKPVRFSPRDVPETPWNETKIISLEHNLDSYSAFSHFAGVGHSRYAKIAEEIKPFIESMWRGDRFYPGYDLSFHAPNADEFYLDTQSWAILAMGAHRDWKAGLTTDCEQFFTVSRNIAGFYDYRPSNRPVAPDDRFVWSEGTLGLALAMKQYEQGKDPVRCQGHSSDQIAQDLEQLQTRSGGLRYATPNRRGFSTSASIAATVWLYFFKKKFNPFNPLRSETWVNVPQKRQVSFQDREAP